MIARYACPQIESIFSPIHRLRVFVEIERLFCSSQGYSDSILEDFSKVDLELLLKDLAVKEKRDRHETVAFIQALGLQMSEGSLPYLHKGATSSDILDTCLATQMVNASDVVIQRLSIYLKRSRRKRLNIRTLSY